MKQHTESMQQFTFSENEEISKKRLQLLWFGKKDNQYSMAI